MLFPDTSDRSVRRERRSLACALLCGALLIPALPVGAALEVPTDVQLPGTQPGEVGNLETASNCDGCHGDRGAGVEIAHEWRGSMMAHAGRDPIFWATMAIAEQDFDGSGDLCLRCHATSGWLKGNSTPTDGSGLAAGDDDGVECGYCHTLTNPDDSEHLGEQFAPFFANDEGTPAVGYYGSGMAVLWDGNEKLGPYSATDAKAKHQRAQSSFHRSVDFCGTCHDVSNSVVGDLAHNNGKQDTAPAVVSSGIPGGPVDDKAAFNNFPYAYGIVERTFSESKSGMLIETRVGDYATDPTFPDDLKAGAIEEAYNRSIVAGTGGDYADGAPRYFSCQTCHMSPTTGLGCNKNGVPVRDDLPSHDLTGGNYWMPAVIQYLDAQDKLVLGGGLSDDEIAGLDAGALRAMHNLENAASLDVTDLTLRVTNLTGHKLISGYPEGRRMWINVKWYDAGSGLLREDGAYGPLEDEQGNPVEVVNPADGQPVQVQSILDLEDPYTRIYEVHHALTQEWASQLIGLGYPSTLPLSFDRYTGAVEHELGDLAGEEPGSYEESFHFVLNNKVVADNRIPTYRMRYDVARVRNVLPVPLEQYGNPGPGGEYQHWDDFVLEPPAGATSATISLLYQPTSWEYIQFLVLANDGSVTFLGAEGDNMLEAWIETGMAAPHTMASKIIEVPEPGGLAMLVSGGGLLSLLARRRRGARFAEAGVRT